MKIDFFFLLLNYYFPHSVLHFQTFNMKTVYNSKFNMLALLSVFFFAIIRLIRTIVKELLGKT